MIQKDVPDEYRCEDTEENKGRCTQQKYWKSGKYCYCHYKVHKELMDMRYYE